MNHGKLCKIMSYRQLRYRIEKMKVNGVEVPMNSMQSFRNTLEIMFNLDMLEKELSKSDMADAKTVLDKIRSGV